jgi:membrane complex biogenesis BtpA family protein
MKPLLRDWAKLNKVVIGMLHLPALPGSPLYGGSIAPIREAMLRDAQLLAEGGVHGLMIENFGDTPFFPGRVPVHVVSHIAALAAEVRRAVPQLPLGINVLRNDGLSALAAAHAVGASYIRVNVLCGARVADQGLLQGIAHELLRLRSELKAESIKIFADVDVKHSAPLAARSIVDEVDDTLYRGMADALIVSGAGTGKPTDPEKVHVVKAAAKETPVFLGSGVTPTSLPALMPHADGFIVGTFFKKDGVSTNPVDPQRVKQLLAALRG